MSGNTTAIERLIEVSNKLWDAMYESGEVPTHAERAYYYLALKDAIDESVKLRELVRDMYKSMDVSCQFGHAIPAGTMAHVKNRAIGLGVEVG